MGVPPWLRKPPLQNRLNYQRILWYADILQTKGPGVPDFHPHPQWRLRSRHSNDRHDIPIDTDTFYMSTKSAHKQQWLTDLCSSGTSAHGETMCIPVFLILLHVLHHLNTTWSSKHPSCHIHLVENRLGMGHCGHLWNVGSRLPTAGFKRDQRRKTPRGRQLISDNLPWKSGHAAAFGPIFGAFNFFSQAACSCTVDKCCKIFESFKTPSSARWAW